IAPADPPQTVSAYIEWVNRGYAGEMRYLERPDRVERRRDPSLIVPNVKSVVVVGKNYFTRQLPPEILNDPSRGIIASYAWGLDYHDVMTPRLYQLQAFIQEQVGSKVYGRTYVDTGPVLEREYAVRAGLGFFGKNTMLIHPRWGAWLFLGEILLDVELAYDKPDPRGTCGACTRCLDTCPTDAFPEPYVLDSRRCISYFTIELKGPIPWALRPLMGNRVFGCDICNEVCPWNRRFARPAEEQGSGGAGEQVGRGAGERGRKGEREKGRKGRRGEGEKGRGEVSTHLFTLAALPSGTEDVAPKLLDLIALDDEAFRERFRGSPIKRAKRRGLLRNVAVALGNWGDPVAVPALTQALHDHEPLVRGHAAWALGQIDSAHAQRALKKVLVTEDDDYVRNEIGAALRIVAEVMEVI
ncbi:MAG: tRNA epoxyqueuosine(34) reductase QueG, partial [Anaerolineae bacterium]